MPWWSSAGVGVYALIYWLADLLQAAAYAAIALGVGLVVALLVDWWDKKDANNV